jgi:amino acid permease
MNIFKSLIAQIHNGQVTEKGRTFGEAKFVVALMLTIIVVLYVLLFVVLTYTTAFGEGLSNLFFDYFTFLGENRFGYKLMALLLFFVVAGFIFLILRPKFYNALINEYEDLTYPDQKAVNKKGEIIGIIFFCLPIVGILICLFNRH